MLTVQSLKFLQVVKGDGGSVSLIENSMVLLHFMASGPKIAKVNDLNPLKKWQTEMGQRMGQKIQRLKQAKWVQKINQY